MFLQRDRLGSGYREEIKDSSVSRTREVYTLRVEYVEQRNGRYYVAGVRVTLDSVA
jgi:hypothetical protein